MHNKPSEVARYSVILGIEGLLVQDIMRVESLCCVLDEDTLSAS